MSNYTFDVSVNGAQQGAQQLGLFADSIDKSTDRTKRLSDILNSQLAQAISRVGEQQKSYAEKEAQIAALREQYAQKQQALFEREEAAWRRLQSAQDSAWKTNQRQQDDAVKATEKRIAAAQKLADAEQKANALLGASIKNFIQNPLGAAASAAEQFALQYGEAGIAAVAVGASFIAAGIGAFNLANRVAGISKEAELMSARTGLSVQSAQLFSRAAELAGADAGAFETSMRTLSKTLSDSSEEGKKGKKAIADLGVQIYDVSTGAMRSMDDIYSSILRRLGAMPETANRNTAAIEILGRSALTLIPLSKQFDELTGRVTASGAVINGEGIAAAENFRRAWADVGLELDGVKNSLGVIAATGIAAGIHALRFANAAIQAPAVLALSGSPSGRDSEMAESGGGGYGDSMSLIGHNALARDLKKNDASVRAAQMSGDDNAELKAAKAKLIELQGKLKLGVLPEVNEKALGDVDAQKKVIAGLEAQAKATKKLAEETERLTEQQKRARELYAKSLQDVEPTAQRKYNDAMIGAFATNRDEQRKAISPGQHQQVDANSQLEMKAAFNNFQADRAKEIEKATEELGSRIAQGIEQGGKEFEKNFKESLNDSEKFAKEGFGGITQPVPTVAPPPGYRSPEQQVKDARDKERRGLSVINVSGQLAGASESQITQATYNAKIQFAKAEYDAEMRLADLKKTSEDRDKARADALDQQNEKIFDAQMEREQAVLQMALKQKEEFQSLATGFLDAGRSGGGAGLQKFMMGQLNGIEDKIVGNMAGAIWPTIQKAMSGMHTQSGSFMGTMLQGTPFGPKAASPEATASDKNSLATNLNTAATNTSNDLAAQRLQLMPGSPTYNASLVQAADAQYGYSPVAGGYSPVGSAYSPLAGAFSSASSGAIPDLASSSSSSLGLAAAITAAAGGGASSAALIKSFASDAAGIGKMMTASKSSSSTGGLFGGLFSGSSGSGISKSDTGYTDDNVQKYSPENYDDDGIFLGAGATSSHDSTVGVSGKTFSTGTASQTIASVAAVGAAAFAAYSGFKAGGAQGALQGTSAILGAASMIPIPVVQPILMAAAAVTSLVATVLGDPKTNREKEITRNLKYSNFMAPAAVNETMSTGGTFSDFDRFGGTRTSDLSPRPMVEQGFYDYRNNQVIQGRTVSQFGAPVAGPSTAPVTLVYNPQVSAMDGTDVQRVFNAHLPVLGDAMAAAVNLGHAGAFQDTMRNNM